jgi:predicted small lipoprotein YifL
MIVLVLMLGATACGKKGALELPEGAPADRPRPGR